ncbi:MAG: hypothetical protein ACYS32_13605 [Planctomycetota bacterium]|jgi:hypothetical protein
MIVIFFDADGFSAESSDITFTLRQQVATAMRKAVAFFYNTSEAGMICETAEHRAEGMEVNGSSLPKRWQKVSFGHMCSTSWWFPA